jgi:hypothetical protein
MVRGGKGWYGVIRGGKGREEERENNRIHQTKGTKDPAMRVEIPE